MRLLLGVVIGLAVLTQDVLAQNLNACINQANENYYADNNNCRANYDVNECERDYQCPQGDMSDPHAVDVYNRCIEQRNNCIRFTREQGENCLSRSQERRNRQVSTCQSGYSD